MTEDPRSSSDRRPATGAPAPRVDAGGIEHLIGRFRQDGDVIRHGRMTLFAHPDAVRDVFTTNDRQLAQGPLMAWTRLLLGNGLLTSNGSFHDGQRALIQPVLHPKRVARYGGVAVRHAAAERDAWQPGQVVDAHPAMLRVTLRVMAESLFGAAVGPEADSLARSAEMSLLSIQAVFRPGGGLRLLLPTPRNLRLVVARRAVRATLRRFVAARRRSHRADPDGGLPTDDLLARLLDAREGGDGRRHDMTERQLMDESVTLFAAGHESTAAALTFSLWLLAHHRGHQATVKEELDDVLGDRTEPTAADLDRLTYTRMVVAESLRLFPPIWIQTRLARRAMLVNGTAVGPGDELMVVQWATHRDERWWPDPGRFDPLRFAPGRPADRPRWAYFPFGGGRRACVGEAFAWAEVTLALATILRRWWVEPADDQPLTLDPGITLRPKHPVCLRVRS